MIIDNRPLKYVKIRIMVTHFACKYIFSIKVFYPDVDSKIKIVNTKFN
ncbi:unnamed protein product [Acanthoscelides obtectus]|uniref:Uncharacterized protein n=1 Tax=Acanthoscelides obtectus TaxID=200917 RepID=A0A9P0PM68_ACAOB|nr:unnamed protein product [Acanthoscelides obtectus]CAK1651821.1 hypothetical protein AOBTE_LOCUS17476 [Acanthoscelides obtectus]